MVARNIVLYLLYNIIQCNANNNMEAVVRKQTSFRLREDLLQILQEQAKKANRSLNNFVESTLMDAMYSVPNEETIAAIREARAAKNKETFDSVESLMEELRK